MTLLPPALSIHEPDVALTDLGLALLGAWLAWRLVASTPAPVSDVPVSDTPARVGALRRSGAVIMAGLASAALWGAIFHAFFPAKTASTPGYVAWIPVVLSIVVVAGTLLRLALALLVPRLRLPVVRPLVLAYAIVFAVFVLLVDDSFTSIVRFYGPVLVLMLIASSLQVLRTGSAGWALVAAGFAVSTGAALLQQAKVSIHPLYFNYNAVYHVVQGIALVLLYHGFMRAPGAPIPAFAARIDQTSRAG